MEGHTHAGTGALLGIGAGLLTTAGGLHGVTIWDGLGRDLMFGTLTAGCALLPDADHPDASFAHAAGWLSHGISHLVAAAMGGHRAGFHSFFGIGLMMLVTAACTSWWPNHWALVTAVHITARWVCMQPFGWPVVPEVYGMTAKSSGPARIGSGV